MHLRRATLADARQLADLLNAIIMEGGTTTLTAPLTRIEMEGWIGSNQTENAFIMVEDSAGQALGFQAIGPRNSLPQEACDIATFARKGRAQLGIGSALFEEIRKAAKALGYSWINATVLKQNTGGLAYYQSRSFEPYKTAEERVFMRYNLR